MAERAKVLVVGVAYKKDIDDTRESPAFDIINLLRARGAEVAYHDPFVADLRINGEVLSSQPLTATGYDCAVIATDHSDIDYGRIVSDFPLVIDTRNATRDHPAEHVLKI